MESVEERRIRLAAMREQAASQAEDDVAVSSFSPSIVGAAPPLLANPLDDPPADGAAAAAEVNIGSSSRFDFYTDPLAGFQGSKRRRPPASALLPNPSQPPPQSCNATPHIGAGILPAPPSHLSPAFVYPPPQGPSNLQPVAYQPHPYQNQAFSHPQPPQFSPQIPPHMNQPFGRVQNRGGYSGRYNNGRQSHIGPAGRGDVSGRGFPPNSFGAGRASDSRNDLAVMGSGRPRSGEQSWRDGNRREGRGAHGRGQGASRIVSAKEQPHLFAKKSMFEDPWQSLQAGMRS